MKTSTKLAAAAAFIYSIAWFLPVVEDGSALSDGVLPGWEAFRIALSPVWEYGLFSGGEAVWDSLGVGSALTNFGFVAAFAVILAKADELARIVFWVLLGGVLLNAFWFVVPDMPENLRIGYYLWLSSFAVLAAAARAAIPREAAAGAPA